MKRPHANAVDTRHAFQNVLDRTYRRSARQRAFRGTTRQAFSRWRTTTRARLARLLTLEHMEPTPLRLRRLPDVKTDTYTRERLLYDTMPGVIAPRPLAIESATRDPIFPVDVARRTCRQLRKLYGLAGVRDRLVQDVFEGAHEISGAVAPDWLARWLRA